MNELIFLVEEAPEGGFTARALGEAIFTEADTMAELHAQVRDAVRCQFEEGMGPQIIRLHDVRMAAPEGGKGLNDFRCSG